MYNPDKFPSKSGPEKQMAPKCYGFIPPLQLTKSHTLGEAGNGARLFKITIKEHSTMNPLQILWLVSDTLIPLLFLLPEAILEILFHQRPWLCHHGCLDGLKQFKIFAFHGHFDFGKESEVTQCQLSWIRWMGTHCHVFRSLPFVGWLLAGSIQLILIIACKDTHERELDALQKVESIME